MAHSIGSSGEGLDLSKEGGDKATYVVEHLATFVVNEETPNVAGGMQKLLALEESNGIWSQKMHLCLDRSWVIIKDFEAGSVVDRFAGEWIEEPTALIAQDTGLEKFSNILAFIVSSTSANYPTEMHIFQCQGVSAQDLVEDLKEMRSGKFATRNRNRNEV